MDRILVSAGTGSVGRRRSTRRNDGSTAIAANLETCAPVITRSMMPLCSAPSTLFASGFDRAFRAAFGH
jgi:hypothetical protein